MNRVFPAALLLLLTLTPSLLRAQPNITALEEKAIQDAVRRVSESVVRIETFGGLEKVGNVLVGVGPTTGLVVDEAGYVVSSAFNFAQMPSSILVTLPSGKRAPAEIVARDRSRMLVLLKVNGEEKLKPAEATPRSEMSVGQWSVAVGRTFSLQHPNISVGILAARNRIWGKAIQTDAKISPGNYGGPLIDIRGRVLGVLVPLSPQKSGEMAGAEWYDSGIGFAVPLADVYARLDHLKKGKDLLPGVMGVSLKGDDIYSLPAEIAVVRAKSPAREAGLKKGDRIVEVNGAEITRQSQLKHQLGPLYAGDNVELVVLRGDDKEKVKASLKLIDKLIPYEHPFLGILPERTENAPTSVRFVYPESPAAKADIKIGDRVVSLQGKAVEDADQLREQLAAFEPKQTVKLELLRGEDKLEVEIVLESLPVDVPDSLPAAKAPEGEAGDKPDTGVIDVKIPEQANECFALVPDNYRADVPHSLIVYLAAPGKYDKEAIRKQWEPSCASNQMILLAPKPGNERTWRATETEFVHKTIEEVRERYNIDSNRIVLHGYQAGGAMSFLTAFARPDLVTGIAPVDAALPARARAPDNDPQYRIAVYWTYGAKGRLAAAVKARAKQLKDKKFPVTLKELPEAPKKLSDDQLGEFFRWIDSLDRI